MERLVDIHDETKPVAILPSHSEGSTGGKAVARHFDKNLPKTAIMCVGSIVSIAGKNFRPKWGLHNGAIGKVISIVFGDNKNPNNGDLPLYTVVDFPTYCGPAWDRNNPTHVPIPNVTVSCDRPSNCCKRTFVPLVLSFARTIHRFQGLSVGPTSGNQIPNMYQCIVCHPGTRKREGNCPGLLYTAVSRATTLGNDDALNSAIYFVKNTITDDRIRRLTHQQNGKSNFKYKTVASRDKWMSLLEKGKENRFNMAMTHDKINDTCEKAVQYTCPNEKLRDTIRRYCVHMNKNRN